MKRARDRKLLGINRHLVIGLVVITGCALWAVPAFAQGAGGPQLSAADRAAAWEVQAKGVATSLGLNEDQSAKLKDAYTASRQKLQGEVEKLASSSEGGRGRFEAYRTAMGDERKALKTTLSGFLTPEQTDKAIASLGSYSRIWDRMVNTLTGMNLEEAKLNEALNLVAGYVAESSVAMQDAAQQSDWQAIRTKMQDLKTGLDTSLAKVLTEEQLATWKTDTAFRSRGGGQRGESGNG